jgi:hypothetical protein
MTDLVESWNGASTPEVTALEAGYGIGKSQDFLHFPILEETVDESGMEDIAR